MLSPRTTLHLAPLLLAAVVLFVLWSCGSLERSDFACESDPECSQQLLPCGLDADVCDGTDASWPPDAAERDRTEALGFSPDELWTRFGSVGSPASHGQSPGGFALCTLVDVRTDDLGHLSGLRLPDTNGTSNPVPDRAGRCGTELETLTWRLANCERITLGIQPAECDLRLVRLSRDHAGDMRRRGYFEHHSPEGFGPFDRLAAAGTSYLHAGENLARFPVSPGVAEAAHHGWMDSESHRRNLLNEAFTHMGVGAVAGPAQVLFAQLFLRP